MKTILNPAAAIGAIALALLAGPRAANATNYTITVDASKQTAGNPPFWAAAVGTGTAALTLRSDLETHYKIGAREAGFKRVRGHGVLSDAMGIYKGPGSYSWTNFDKYLTSIVSAGMRPIMEMDFMPTALALSGNDKDIYKNATDYKNFIAAIVQHCVDKYGMADVAQWYWEIWNEPDYPGFWNGSNSSEATSAKMSEYYTLYDNAVAAITSVIPNALVGGPATTQSSPVGAFLQHCKSAGTRVTFASSHVYPGGSGAPSADANGLVSDNNSRISQITSGGYTTSSVLSFNTEWNSSYSGQGGGAGDDLTSMDNNWNVGFILKGTKLLSDKNSGSTPPLSVFSYWVLSDVFDESSGPSGSYILGKTSAGTLPFGQVFGLMTFQGIRKAAFNAFKMLNYLGPTRVQSSGGTSSDGVDAMVTTSASGDALQILAYDQYATLNSSGTDGVTINVSNLPSALAGKQVFVTQFIADATHSNPYSVWTTQGKPSAPSEAQLQALKAAQHLALLQPVSTATLTTSYTTTFTMNRQSGTLLILSVKRPVTGRDGLGTIEGEDYDGQSGATKEDSNDTDLGQSISVTSGGSVFYDVVDFSDAGVGSVQMRVNASAATNIEFHADSATGTLLGKCAVSATSGWATQSCTLTQTTGVHTLYAVFGGAARLNWLLFQPGSSSTGTGGSGTGTGGSSGTGGVGGKGGGTGGAGTGAGGTTGTGGTGTGTGGTGTTGTGGTGTTGTGGSNVTGAGGSGTAGAGGPGTGGNGSGTGGSSATGTGGSSTATGGSPGSGGSSGGTSGSSGCACSVGSTGSSFGTLVPIGLFAGVIGLRRRRRPHSRKPIAGEGSPAAAPFRE
jgi:xylan 1,4-beta-xylosidase